MADCVLFVFFHNFLLIAYLIAGSCMDHKLYFILYFDQQIISIRFSFNVLSFNVLYSVTHQFHQAIIIGELSLAVSDIPNKGSVLLNM